MCDVSLSMSSCISAANLFIKELFKYLFSFITIKSRRKGSSLMPTAGLIALSQKHWTFLALVFSAMTSSRRSPGSKLCFLNSPINIGSLIGKDVISSTKYLSHTFLTASGCQLPNNV